MRLSVTVMAHRRRVHLIDRLIERLGIGPERVIWDRKDDRWDTGRRAWEAHDPSADYHITIQDDALVCRDLIPGLEEALNHVPPNAIVSPFVGTRRPSRAKVERVVKEADRVKAAWLVLGPLNWGLAICTPVHTIEEMLPWCDRQKYPNYDRRIGRFFRQVKPWPTWHTWPNLVDHHPDEESLVGHGPGRVSHHFLGEDRSALEMNWSGPVVNYGTPRITGTHKRPERTVMHPVSNRRQGKVTRPARRLREEGS